MNKFITMLALPYTEQLGSQMWHFAALYNISKRSGHRIVFFEEHCNIGRGLLLDRHFTNLPFERISVKDVEADNIYYTYPLKLHFAVETAVFRLDPNYNYNFKGFFLCYKYWWPVREEIRRMYTFSPDVLERAYDVVQTQRRNQCNLVSVHIRRADFVDPNGHSVNLTRDYYNAAFNEFGDSNVQYFVFSDDIEWCRAAFADKKNVSFAEGNDTVVDMCAMSLCDHNIIANSSFGFWGAFFNNNPTKKMIAPARVMSSDSIIPGQNYAWVPDEFNLLDVGND